MKKWLSPCLFYRLLFTNLPKNPWLPQLTADDYVMWFWAKSFNSTCLYSLETSTHTVIKSLKWNLLWDILALELSVAWSHSAKGKTSGSWCKAFLVVDLPEEGGNNSVGVCESIHCSDTLEWLMSVLLASSVWTNKGDIKASLCCNNIVESLCDKD